MENVLYLPLKKKWFDLIKCGIKKEEYREVTSYWEVRLWCRRLDYEEVEFTLGYPKKSDSERRIRYKIRQIRIDVGKPEWGAKSMQEYYVISLGDRIENAGR